MAFEPGSTIRFRRLAAAAAMAVALTGLAACSSDDGGDAEPAPSSTTVADPRADGPAAEVEELTGGKGPFIGNALAGQLDDGYEEQEFSASGTAVGYAAAGELTGDGRWTFEEAGSADYRTRILVRRPADPADASGVVAIEWLNVSGGIDADPEWATLREELVRQGTTWVGVSAQAIGVEGGVAAVQVDVAEGAGAGKGLKGLDPERYGDLVHPGDTYAYDLYTQVARAVRGGAVPGVEPTTVVAVGESQSAFALVTYLNGVQPLTSVFDGFFVHSRGGAGLALPPEGEAADIAGSLGGSPTMVRDDTEVPVLTIQTESDLVSVLGSAKGRQPDTDRHRLWEVAGSAHADRHLIGDAIADTIDCGLPINDSPFHLVAKAAFRAFLAWVDGGDPPPEQPRIELTEDGTAIARDEDGIALGGIRTPAVDAPTRILSGDQGPIGGVICLLSGTTGPMTPESLAERYASSADFEQQWAASAEAAVDSGVVLVEDREVLDTYAHPELLPG